MRITDIAASFRFDPSLLENDLLNIKQRYEKRLKGYETYLNESEVNDLVHNVQKQAEKLAGLLKSIPIDIRLDLNGRCHLQKPSPTSAKKGDTEAIPIADDIINDTINRLRSIERVTSTFSITTCGQNTMHHKDSLVRDLRDSWRKLSGEPPSRSSKNNRFIEFMEWACEFMSIDSKGLGRRHLNTR